MEVLRQQRQWLAGASCPCADFWSSKFYQLFYYLGYLGIRSLHIIYIYTYIYVYIYMYMYIYICVYIYICIYIYMFVCVCVYTYIYICMYMVSSDIWICGGRARPGGPGRSLKYRFIYLNVATICLNELDSVCLNGWAGQEKTYRR